MFGKFAKERRTDRRAFRPTLDGQLEPKLLMAVGHGGSFNAAQQRGGKYQGGFHFQIAFGGQAVQIRTPTDGVFVASLTNLTGTTQGAGTIRAKAVPGDPQHRVDLYLSNTSSQSVLTIDTRGQAFFSHTAHDLNTLTAGQVPILNVRNIIITERKGQPTTIGQILGYHSANLSGAITVTSSSPVDRIAFNNISPGSRVSIAGDLNTLDVVQDINLESGDYVHIGRDLNASQINGNINVGNGAQFTIGRDTGGVVQASKGSEPAYPSPVTLPITSSGGGTASTLFITNVLGGNINVSPGGLFILGRRPQNQFLIHGAVINNGTLVANGQTDAGVFGLLPFVLPIPNTALANSSGTFLVEGGIYQDGQLILAGQSPLPASTAIFTPSSGSSTSSSTN